MFGQKLFLDFLQTHLNPESLWDGPLQRFVIPNWQSCEYPVLKLHFILPRASLTAFVVGIQAMVVHAAQQWLPDRIQRNSVVVGAISVGVLGPLLLRLFSSLSSRKSTAEGILESPIHTVLPGLSRQDQAALPYPPNALPGARDVDTPHGSIRVYEWGPEDGRKILLVHGISTPCLSLAAVAKHLADRGCRVILFGIH